MSALPSMEMLLGSDHPDLGTVALRSLGNRLAIALSAGKYPKGYRHVDPNEDGVFAATDGVHVVIAVVDGHSGFDAAAAALRCTAEAAPGLLEAAATGDAGAAIVEMLERCRYEVLQAVADLDGPRADSATTLTVVAAGPAKAVAASWGDSAAVLCRSNGARFLTKPRPFLGGGRKGSPSRRSFRWMQGDRVLALTDGITAFFGRTVLDELARHASNAETAAQLAGSLIATASQRGAGDNMAVGVAFG